MSLYTVEISGRPIAAFRAEDKVSALHFVEGEGSFQSDLMCLDDQSGMPLWDGNAKVHVREAVEEERNVWNVSRAKALLAGETLGQDDDWLTFLVPVADSTDDGDAGEA